MLGKKLGYTEAAGTLRRISMGQGQEPIAEDVIDTFSKNGGWVFLDNVHLMSKWLPKLNRCPAPDPSATALSVVAPQDARSVCRECT